MKHVMTTLCVAALLASSTASIPARADDGRVAAGVAGGLLGGLFLGSALASRPHYYPAPAPVYYDAPPPPLHCYWTRGEPVWDGYLGAWRRPRIQVCD
jgi:hypothetical protein